MKMIFEGYVTCFREMVWGPYGTYTDWTVGDFGFFRRLGQSLGFQVVQEYGKIDMCWLTPERKMYLYLERETHTGNSDRTMEKILRESREHHPELVVGVFAWLTPDRYTEITTELKGHTDFPLVIIASVGDQQDSACDIRCRVYDQGEVWERSAVADTDKSTTWYAYFKKEENWKRVS